MRPLESKAPCRANGEGAGESASGLAIDSVTRADGDAQAAKIFAVWLYRIGALSLVETQAAFDKHPLWRSA